ncbi:acyl-CoA synthetase [Maricurvus nonylphenolicus]|uniref:AMP-binding protein n=1 Tax=Maricurvus nonylphenolicus TaxID=1008307 RepID=UPI0036F33836
MTTITSATDATNVYELLNWAADQHGDRTALTYLTSVNPWQDVTISYQALQQSVNRAARLFRQSFSESGERRGVVSILLPNIPQNHIALWAAEAVGVANPLNPLLSADALASLMAKAETDVIVALGPNPFSDIWQKAESVAATLAENGGKAPRLIAVGGEVESQFDALLAEQSADELPDEWLPAGDDVAAYFHTGGTTGMPKLALHTHTNQLCTAFAYINTMASQPGDAGVNGLPMFHVAGALVNGLGAIAAAANMVLPTALGFRDPQVIAKHWELVERYKVCVSGGIPTSVAAMVGTPVGDADISSLRFMVGGGAPVPASLYGDVERVTGVSLYSIYGMTECAGVIAMPNLDKPTVPGSAGHISAPVEVLIDGAKHVGDSGEICVRGPMVFPGYLGHDEDPLAEGWLRTGDLGHLDADNNLFITGRAKDLIIRSGHNIDPAMIEHCLEDHPAVALAAAVGWPDDYAGELPVAFVQLHPDQTVSVDELMNHAQDHIDERPACPKRIVILEALPVTAVGKIHKPSLRAITAEGAVAESLADQGFADVLAKGQVLASGGIEVEVAGSAENLAAVCDRLASVLGLTIKVEASC